MHGKMSELYRGLAKYFVFDTKKYSLDEFFGDIKTFNDKFAVSLKKLTNHLRWDETGWDGGGMGCDGMVWDVMGFGVGFRMGWGGVECGGVG